MVLFHLFASTYTQAKTLFAAEIQERLADMAQRSIQLNQLDQQCKAIYVMINLPLLYSSKVDMIFVTPLFQGWQIFHQWKEHYLLARHEISILKKSYYAQRVLKSNGRLAMVHRPDRF